MAALSIGCSSFIKNNSVHTNKPTSRIHVSLYRQSREPIDSSSDTKMKMQEKWKEFSKRLFSRLYIDAEKMGSQLKENMSPKQKGDWKDLMLMSLSFAVYVYISQKIVCAYCVWMSMLK